MGIDMDLYTEIKYGDKWRLVEDKIIYIPSKLEHEIFESFTRIEWAVFTDMNPSPEVYKMANISNYDIGIYVHVISPSIRMFAISI